jgi:cell division protein ZapA
MLVLGCLRMAAKYVQLNREYKEFRQVQERSISQLIDKVSSGLD